MKYKNAFTLIELLVVISIIGLLSSVVLVALNGARLKARDTKRKADLRQIRTALDLYYSDNGKYPQAGGCAYGTNCYVYSTSGTNWIPALVPAYMAKAPQDPVNNLGGPWTTGHLSYAYGNVTADGQQFDLAAQLESVSDPDRCQIKKYIFRWVGKPWCGLPNNYSDQMYAP